MSPGKQSLRHVMSMMLTPLGRAGNVNEVPAPRTRQRFADAARQLLRETLLDAASELVRERSWAATTMADIAKAAGVSRQTLYKEFGSRQTFAQAYVIREADRFLVDVENAVAANADDPKVALAAAMEVFLNAVAEEPLIKAIAAGEDPDGLLPLVTNQAGPVLVFATQRLTRFLGDTWPHVPESSVRKISEYLIRLAISFAASPPQSVQNASADIADVFGPYLEQIVSVSGR